MKRKLNRLFLLLPLMLIIPSLKTGDVVRVKAAGLYSSASLPTTIVLNDSTESEVRSYYSALNSLSAAEKQGENLLKNLKPILSNEQKYYKYDNDNSIWKMYEITDRDWAKSPASSITYGTYDAATNTITNYEYGSMSQKKNNPYIHALYVDRSVDNPKTAWDVHSGRSSAQCIEREHIWPKSHGFDADEVAGARGDPMHLWAADGQTNGIHSNYFYGYVDLTKDYKNTRDADHPWNGNNYLGFSKTFTSYTEKVFEPQDCDKGDIARACFYMVARYNNIAGNDDTIGSANPNLCLSDDVSKSEETGTSTSTTAFSLGVMKDLLEWNKLDPVDEYEIHRNNLLFKNYTNNRNPFIDFPEWADLIWGEDKASKSANPTADELYKGGSYTPTPSTDPSGDEPGSDVPTPDSPSSDTPVDNRNFFEQLADKFGIDVLYVYIGCAVIALIVVIVVIAILAKGKKKDKKKLKKTAKKIYKNSKKK